MRKIINNPKKLIEFTLPCLILLTYFFLVLEIFKGGAVLSRRVYINGTMLMSVVLVVSLFIKAKRNKFHIMLLKFNKMIMIPAWIFYFYFAYMEVTHYTNYVLATYRLHQSSMIFLPLFTFYLWLVNNAGNYFPKYTLPKDWKALLHFIK